MRKRSKTRHGVLTVMGTLFAGAALLGGIVASGSNPAPRPDRQHVNERIDRSMRPSTLKPIGRGLYLTSGMSTDVRHIDHAVIDVRWAELEPHDQAFLGPAWGHLRSRIHREPDLKVRIRILAGRFAPDFVKKLAGPPLSSRQIDCSQEGGIAIVQPSNGIASCVPYFWTDDVLRQYKQLMTEVSRRFDDDPHVLDVVDSACMTNWAEPFIRAGNDRGSNVRLWEAGLDETTDRHCLLRSVR